MSDAYQRAIRGEPSWETSTDESVQAVGANSTGGPLPVSEAPLVQRQRVLRSVLAFTPAEEAIAGEDPLARVVDALRRRWNALLARSRVTAPEVDLKSARQLDPSLGVEWQTQDALAALAAGDLERATQVARRASRIAASEGVLQGEYLANLVLARVRRATGMAHYAIRILDALARVVPAIWKPWVELEQTLAGATSAGFRSDAPPLWGVELDTYRALLAVKGDVPPVASPVVFGTTNEIPFGLRDPSTDP
ncbi:MAG: hypothetical protein AAGE52_41125, partial [Myxococcota bacterium]